MDFPDGQRPRLRGKPFKLFTDDLPKVDFNKDYVHEFSRESTLRRRWYHEKQHRRFNFDQLSLPPLGSPDLDSLSIPEPRRPKSELDVLNPNFAQIQKKIRRRHTEREHRDRIILDHRFRRATDDLLVNNLDLDFNIDKRNADLDNKITECVKDIKHQKEINGNQTEITSDSEKPKSVFKQLLEASARETARKKLVEDGFKMFSKDNKIRRRRTVVSDVASKENLAIPSENKTDDNRTEGAEKDKQDIIITVTEYKDASHDTAVDTSVTCKSGESKKETNRVHDEDHDKKIKGTKTKPGILKYNSSVKNANIKPEPSLKPRLVHHDNISDIMLHHKPTDNDKNTARTRAPLDRLSVLVYADDDSKKRKSKRRVNFDQMLDDDADSVDDKKNIDEGTDNKAGGTEVSFTELHSEQSSLGEKRHQHKRKVPNVRKSKSFNIKQNSTLSELKPQHISSFTRNKTKATPVSDNLLNFEKLTENLKDPRADPFWKEAKDSLQDKSQAKEESELQTAETSQPKDVSICRAPVRGNSKRNRPNRIRMNVRPPRIPSSYNMFSDSISTPTNSSIFGNVDLESLPDLESFLDDIDNDAFPDEIDRSLLGKDLIKAYRLWDRKRKLFPGGLRKIEAPLEPSDDFIFSKPFGAFRTYKIPSQPPQDIRHPSSESKEPFGSVFIGSF